MLAFASYILDNNNMNEWTTKDTSYGIVIPGNEGPRYFNTETRIFYDQNGDTIDPNIYRKSFVKIGGVALASASTEVQRYYEVSDAS